MDFGPFTLPPPPATPSYIFLLSCWSDSGRWLVETDWPFVSSPSHFSRLPQSTMASPTTCLWFRDSTYTKCLGKALTLYLPREHRSGDCWGDNADILSRTVQVPVSRGLMGEKNYIRSLITLCRSEGLWEYQFNSFYRTSIRDESCLDEDWITIDSVHHYMNCNTLHSLTHLACCTSNFEKASLLL